jgi:predicted MFS family arabinose efflux permease
VLWNAARFIGPAIAGVIIVVFGIGYAFLANALSYLAFLLALTMIDLPAGTATTRRGQSLVTQIVEGFKYACGHPGIGPLLLLMIATALLARPFTELLPGFADRVFERGAVGLATLTSVTGIGAIIGGLWLGQRGDVTGLTRIAVINIAVFALSLLAFTATDSFPVALVSVLFAGFSMVVSGISSQTLIQISAQGPMLGRVLSLYGLTWRAGPALGALIMGSLADSLGMRWPVAGGATLCLVGWVFAMRHRQRLAALLESEPPEDC